MSYPDSDPCPPTHARASTRSPSRRAAALAALTLTVALGSGATYYAMAALPPMPFPPANPLSEEKRILGKILFWDEQLSTSMAVSCGTCHSFSRAGTDPRLARNAGIDNLLNTPDDILGSPGVILSDAQNDFQRHATFGLAPQITNRSSTSPVNAGYAPQLFWDGRATSSFTDPETNTVAINNGGALESQAVGPLLNTTEMVHAGFDWATLKTRLESFRPLDLATNIPADVASVLATKPGYPELFRQAFGTPTISARRIAFAIATYQRTLVSDQAPWDRFVAGQTTALTPSQQQGLTLYQNQGKCNICHTLPQATGFTFRNIGIRPPAEDLGRQIVTLNNNDRGRFKVPSLRNAGLKATFMHNGQFTTMGQVVAFYARAPGSTPQFADNLDPALVAAPGGPPAIPLNPQQQASVADFVANGLLDTRVQTQVFPFDRPTLFIDRAASGSTVLGAGTPGLGSLTPMIIARTPAMIGNKFFRIGLANARPGASATLNISTLPPVNGRITPTATLGSKIVDSIGTKNGMTTMHLEVAPDKFSPGQAVFFQWSVADVAAVGGEALSPVARFIPFCGSMGCLPIGCSPADIAADDATPLPSVASVNNGLTEGDYNLFFMTFFDAGAVCDIANDNGSPRAPFGTDTTNNGVTEGDYNLFFSVYFDGCAS